MFRIKSCIILLSVVVLFANGCSTVSHGRMAKIYLEDLDIIEIGVSTKDDIIKAFGEPQKIIYRENDIESFIYTHGVERSVFIPFIISWGRAGGTGENLVINFAHDKAMNYEFIVDQRHLMD